MSEFIGILIKRRNSMPEDAGGAAGGLVMPSISTILLLAGIYYAFVKGGKKRKMGYMLLIVWAWMSGMLTGLIPTAA